MSEGQCACPPSLSSGPTHVEGIALGAVGRMEPRHTATYLFLKQPFPLSPWVSAHCPHLASTAMKITLREVTNWCPCWHQ